jgi:hypothetical protein
VSSNCLLSIVEGLEDRSVLFMNSLLPFISEMIADLNTSVGEIGKKIVDAI